MSPLVLIVLLLIAPLGSAATNDSPRGREPASGQADAAGRPSAEKVVIDGRQEGRTFDGVGGVSAGASTRLLYDYPEPYRRDILDYLFKPNYGAGTQILKVEIGGDMNSTDGAEASHQRTRDEIPNYGRGYEWWLMQEAKARNPRIILAGLEWGVPGWMRSDAAGKSAFWSRDNIDYIIRWLDGARRHGLKIDYVGGWNESGYDEDWFARLHDALKGTHPEVKIIAADDLPNHNWRVAKAMLANPRFMAAVDVVGQHSPGVWRSLYQKYSAPPEARQLGKPLWASEESSMSHDVGGGSWARGLNRAYIDARITASLNWAPVSAWYGNLPLADTGLILAEWPWSGHYALGSSVWAYAHTTQFAQPGWRYIDTACGYLGTGASYVTLQDPLTSTGGRNYSIVIETLDATAPSTVDFTLRGGLSTGAVHVWRSNMASATLDDDFIQAQVIQPENGAFSLTLEPGCLYSLTTTTGQSKGATRPPADAFAQLPLPFVEDFESYQPGKLARYFSDINGGFETAAATGGRNGMVYRQVVPQQPVAWNLSGAGGMPPTTLFGDPRWWGDYETSVDVMLEQAGYVELLGRVAAQAGQQVSGYHLQVSSTGAWRLYSQELTKLRPKDEDIASGKVPFAERQWHALALRMRGDQIAIVIDGRVVHTARDDRQVSGNVGLRVSGWQNAQFDNVRVTRTAPPPEFVPQKAMTVTATSEHPFFYRGDVFPAAYAADGRPESVWHTRFEEKTLPQSITLDLGAIREVAALAYQPRLDNLAKGMITRYDVQVSTDGREFTKVAEGEWRISSATKIANWPARRARFVRLEAVAAAEDTVSAGEINISTTPLGR